MAANSIGGQYGGTGRLAVLLLSVLSIAAALLAGMFSAGTAGAASAPPAPSITAQPASPTNQTAASFSFTDSQSGVAFQCKLDAAAFAACSSPKGYTGLAAGSHTFQVQASAAGKTSSATSFTWTVDLTAPPAPSISCASDRPDHVDLGELQLHRQRVGRHASSASSTAARSRRARARRATAASRPARTPSRLRRRTRPATPAPPASFTWTVDADRRRRRRRSPRIRPNPTNQTSASFSFTDIAGGRRRSSARWTAARSRPARARRATRARSVRVRTPSRFRRRTAAHQPGDDVRLDGRHTPPPVVVVSFPANSGVYSAAGWNAGCSGGAGICGTASDPSGVASGAVSILQARRASTGTARASAPQAKSSTM